MLTRQVFESQAHWICVCCLCLNNRRISDTIAHQAQLLPSQISSRCAGADIMKPALLRLIVSFELLTDIWLSLASESMRNLS